MSAASIPVRIALLLSELLRVSDASSFVTAYALFVDRGQLVYS